MFSDELDALKYRLLTDDYYEAQCDQLEAEYLKMMRMVIVDHPTEAIAFGRMAAAMVSQKADHRMMREKQQVEPLAHADEETDPEHSIQLDTSGPDAVNDI